MKKLRLLLGMGALFITLLSSGIANASTFILDTGTPTGDPTTGLAFYSNNGVYQWMAAQFTLGAKYNISTIETYISIAASENVFDISIYDDNFNRTGLSDTVFIKHNGSRTAKWAGLKNLDWNLGPGTYWVAFENPNHGLAADEVIYFPRGADHPVPAYAKKDDFTKKWDTESLQDGWNFGVRIEGEPVPVAANPIPPTVVLFGSGMVGMAALVRRKKR